MDNETACSLVWDDTNLPAWGTAARADFWVAVEQPGSWGAKALTESGLDAAFARELDRAVSAAGGRLVLIRRPGRSESAAARTVIVSWRDQVVLAQVEDLSPLLDVAWADGPSALAPLGFAASDPVVLVCTNGKRDACCSVRGRVVAQQAAAEEPGAVWESSHLGGHRLAPTAVVLPTLVTVGRVDAGRLVAALRNAREGRIAPQLLGPRYWRGLSCLEPRAQVADAFVRAELEETDPGALRLLVRDDGVVEVTHRDGRRFAVRVDEGQTEPLPASCGKLPAPQRTYAARWAEEPRTEHL